jgi:Putative transposase
VRPRGVERAQRGQIGCLDVQRLAKVTQQGRRHGANAVQRPPAHAHEADVQRQSQLVVVTPAPFDQLPLSAAEGEEGLQLERGDLARQVTQAQVRCVPALHRRRSPRVERQAKIRLATANSKCRGINDLPLHARAVAGRANRHFLHRNQREPQIGGVVRSELRRDAKVGAKKRSPRVEAHDRKRPEQLCRYITRPALSDERVQLNAAGQVELKLKTPWRGGTTHLVMSPLEFMQRLAALVPLPRLLLTCRPDSRL